MTKGTKEWAEKNVNFCIGCSNDCLYCYAKRINAQYRSDGIDWKIMRINQKKIDKNYRKINKTIMIPSSHDITPEILNESLIVLKKLLSAGNKLLLVSKPNLKCIKAIIKMVHENSFKKQIEFRFTITSYNHSVLKFWEPGASDFEERLQCLKECYDNGFTTSVSIEPFLDNVDGVYILVNALEKFVSNTIWIGTMSNIPKSQIPISEYDRLRNNYSKRNLINLIGMLKNNKKIKWKDSIANQFEKQTTLL